MGRKLHIVEKVPSSVFLTFVDSIVLEIETYLTLFFQERARVGGERNEFIFLLN